MYLWRHHVACVRCSAVAPALRTAELAARAGAAARAPARRATMCERDGTAGAFGATIIQPSAITKIVRLYKFTLNAGLHHVVDRMTAAYRFIHASPGTARRHASGGRDVAGTSRVASASLYCRDSHSAFLLPRHHAPVHTMPALTSLAQIRACARDQDRMPLFALFSSLAATASLLFLTGPRAGASLPRP